MFLVCGEILYDLFVEDRPDSSLVFDARPGGSPFNVAVGLARLGYPVSFAGAVSSDFLGERLLRTLGQEQVNTHLIVRKPKPTTLSFVALDADGNAEYAFYGEGAADRDFARADLKPLPRTTRAIHVGSFSVMVRPIGDTIEMLVRKEHAQRLISYDPNVRLNVMPDPAQWRARIDALAAHVHVLKMSTDDLARAYPGESPTQRAEAFISAGVRIVILTAGFKGATAWTNRHHVEIPAKNVTVVDTIGAGDSFQAGFLGALAERSFLSPDHLSDIEPEPLRALLATAAKSSAFTCTRRGAQMPKRTDVP
jgi:fructokinase